MNIYSIVAVCIITAILAKIIEPTSREIKLVLSVAAVVMVLLSVSEDIELLFDGIESFSESFGLNEGMLSLSIKVIGIGYVCELSENTLRDSGETALASVIDICGKLSVAILCLPVISSLMETVVNILE